MDALTNAAIQTLIQQVFPKLSEHLKLLLAQKLSDRKSSPEVASLVNEAFEILQMLKQWSGPSKEQAIKTAPLIQPEIQPEPEADFDENMSDDEAMRLLAEMEGGEPPAPPPKAPLNPSPVNADAASPKVVVISDDEAMRLLAEMDGPSAPSTPSPAAKASETKKPKTGVLSADEEAEMLLAELEQGGGDKSEDVEAPTIIDNNHDHGHAAPAAGSDEECEEIEEWTPNDFQTDPDMINDFNTNTDELMQSLDEAILRLEQDASNQEIIEEIFRAAHTIKGAAGMFGFKALERIMHRLENLFDLIRKGKLAANSDIVDLLFQGMDVIKTLLAAVKNGKPCGIKTKDIVIALTQAAKGNTKRVAVAKAPKVETEHAPAAAPAKGKSEEISTIRVDLKRLDSLVNLVGELVIDRTRFSSIEEEMRVKHPKIKMLGTLSETVQLFGRHMNEFQDIIMKVRMVPIGNAFNKFGRIVRDLAKTLNKNINLHISGESAELDKTLVEQIGDPLIHLIRNACDHGIEDAQTRTANNKSPDGNVYLSAHQEGNNIVISIRDDGKGMDPEVIRRKAQEKGLVKPDEKLSEREIFNLIFEPGFSTAEKVSNISGRGVGMDVVKKQIMKLKGLVEIESKKQQGSTIIIRLPLTLAIVQSLLVRVQSETYAFPLSSVIESIRIERSDIQRVGDAEVIKLRDKVLPLMHLGEALHLDQKKNTLSDFLDKQSSAPSETEHKYRKSSNRLFVVVVGHADRPFGVVVDQLLNQQEMVIKSMGPIMTGTPCIAGGAVLGNGEVVLVLDVPELEEAFTAKSRKNAA
ncbi:MAG: chemotaxis protein CheW [Oligoflexales bacterium]